MPKKRRSGGRGKGRKGRSQTVQCSMCGNLVPRDKAKRVTVRRSLVDRQLAKELRASGAYLGHRRDTRIYCISCAVHHRVVKVRSRNQRKAFGRLR